MPTPRVFDDSRKVGPGDIFVAIDGGHDFVAMAVLERGAALAVVQREIPDVPSDKQKIVPDTRRAFLEYGAAVRDKFNGVVIAVTGSAGKTTTKEMLRMGLGAQARVYATSGNFNNEIGVARTLCDMDLDADVAVVEIGMNHAGEIENLVQFVRPDVAVITNVFPMHIEFFPDGVSGIARAKAEIFSARPRAAVINGDAMCADVLVDAAQAVCDRVEIFHGTNNDCVLAAVLAAGFDVKIAVDALRDFTALPGRGKVYKLKIAGGEYALVDESYSGQPESVKMALEKLARHTGRKIAVLGKMAELGEHSRAMHMDVGDYLSKLDIDIVVGICPETKDILSQLSPHQKSFYFDDNTGLTDFLLNNLLMPNDNIMIKGSHYGSRLFETAEVLIEKGSGFDGRSVARA